MKRKKIISIMVFFFWLMAAAGITGFSRNTSSLINKVRDSIERIKPFKVNFTQQVFDEDQLEIEESGEIVFKDKKTLKWTYLDPDYKVFLLIGDDYKFYDQDNEQLTIGRVTEKNRRWLWQLLFSQEMADYIKTDNLSRKVYIKNETDNLDIEIEINSEYLPVKAIQKDPSGVILVYHFKDYRKRIKITGDIFTLEVPEGVDVVRE